MRSRRARPARRRHRSCDHATYPHRRQRNRPFSYAASTQAHRGQRYSTGDVPYTGGRVAGKYPGGTPERGAFAGGPVGGMFRAIEVGVPDDPLAPPGTAPPLAGATPVTPRGRTTSWTSRKTYRT